MELLRGTALVILGVLLLVTTLGANLVIGVDRTVMDSGFMTDAMAEEEAYTAMAAELNSTGNGTGMTSVVDPRFLRNQTEATIPVFYDYLHDERDHLVVPVMTGEIQDRIATMMTQQVRSSGLADVDPQLARMAQGQQQYNDERQQFRQDEYQRLQQETDEQLSEEELAMMYDERRSEIRSRIITDEGSMEGLPDTIASELRVVKAHGLTNESMTYEQFDQQLNTRIGQSMPENTTASMDIPDRINLSARMDTDQRRQVETAQRAVQGIESASIGLPVAVLVLAGLVWLAAATGAGALLVLGVVVGLAGLISTAAMAAARTMAMELAREAVISEMPAAMGTAVSGLLRQIIDTFLTQSLLVLLIGIGLMAGGIYLRRSGPSQADDEDDPDHEMDEDPS